MEIGLSPFEIEILNRFIPTQTFSNPAGITMAVRNLLVENREVLRNQGVTDQDFGTLLAKTGHNIFTFLRTNEFYYERDGGIYYITEKGKQLHKQGSFEKYMEWREQVRAKNIREMQAIQEKGYVPENQPKEVEKSFEQKKKKFGFFTL
jgi:hypothetical protein